MIILTINLLQHSFTENTMQTPAIFLAELLRTTKECFKQSSIYTKTQKSHLQMSIFP
jgi:hypothetical protein